MMNNWGLLYPLLSNSCNWFFISANLFSAIGYNYL
jgi:hypothetical protein